MKKNNFLLKVLGIITLICVISVSCGKSGDDENSNDFMADVRYEAYIDDVENFMLRVNYCDEKGNSILGIIEESPFIYEMKNVKAGSTILLSIYDNKREGVEIDFYNPQLTAKIFVNNKLYKELSCTVVATIAFPLQKDAL